MNKWNLGKVRGEDGKAATIAIGTVRTGQAGSDAKVENVGDSVRAIFDFTIPRGEKGDEGDKGNQAYTAGTNVQISGGVISATDTTYDGMTQAEATAGTSTAQRLISPKVLKDTISGGAVLLTGEQTVAGTKTFTSFPVTPSSAPTANYQAANKKYVDDKVASGGSANNGIGFGQNIINFAVSGTDNISYSQTLQNNTTGKYNTASGADALRENTTGSFNTAAGVDALKENTTGSSNTASGASALQNNTEGNYNTASGANALRDNTTGKYNTAAGAYALKENTTGSSNTASGASALRYNTEGNYNTASGADALRDNTTYSNCSGLGYDSQVTASNQIQLGNSTTTVYAYGAVQNRSDARDKTEIRDTVLGLDFINAIRPVDYKLDMREDYRVELGENPTEEQLEANKLANIQTDGTHTRKRYHHGVIAQQVAETMAALGVDFGGFQDHSKNGGDDVLSIGYDEFIAPLIKAVQELSARVEELEGKG